MFDPIETSLIFDVRNISSSFNGKYQKFGFLRLVRDVQ